MSKIRRITPLAVTGLIGSSLGLALVILVSCGESHPSEAPLTYLVLEDHMDNSMTIGIEWHPDVSDAQLRATLWLAANEHQRDEARDLLGSGHFWVKAHLLRQGIRSPVEAGELRRYVPAQHPTRGWVELFNEYFRGGDRYGLSLNSASQSFSAGVRSP